MYRAFYNLEEEPFRLTPDPRFLHLAEPHRAALTVLIRAVALRKGFVMVTGPVGTGKTTLLHATLQILSRKLAADDMFATAFIVNPLLSPQEFYDTFLDEFEVSCPSASKPHRLAALQQMFLARQRQGGTAILIIDEAHLLTVELLEEIRLLSNTDTYREKLVQIILCGQPELALLLDQPQMRALQQRIAARCQLRALSLAETRSYIAERLHAAGLRAASPFLPAALEEIYRYARGIPRLINLLCDACLTLGCDTQQKVVHLDIVEEAAAALGMQALAPAEPQPSHGLSSPQENHPLKSTVDILIKAMKQGREDARIKP